MKLGKLESILSGFPVPFLSLESQKVNKSLALSLV